MIGEPEVKRICTLALARSLFPGLDSHTLGAMTYHFLGDAARPLLRSAHSAAGDCETLRHVLRHLVVELRKTAPAATWENLWVASEAARIPTVMPFGKHKGEAIAEVPLSYIEWMLDQTDIDPYFRTALEQRIG